MVAKGKIMKDQNTPDEDVAMKELNTLDESVNWLVSLDEDLANRQNDYRLALKRVSMRFDFNQADLKSAIKAKRDGKINEALGKLDEKRDVLEALR